MIALPSISPVTAAALQGPTRYLAIPSFTDCPTCEGRGVPLIAAVKGIFSADVFTTAKELRERLRRDHPCDDCDGSGRVPLVVKVGDRLTVPISDELPEHGTRFGGWGALNVAVSHAFGSMWLIHRPELPFSVSDGRDTAIAIVPGGSLSGTVAAWPDSDTAALPIIGGDLSDDLNPALILHDSGGLTQYGPMLSKPWVDLAAELPYQDFTPGDQVVLLDDVTVTP